MSQQLLKNLETAARTVREHAGGVASKAMIEMLECLEKTYLDDLRDVPPDGLLQLQAQTRQIATLRKLLQGEQTNGRV